MSKPTKSRLTKREKQFRDHLETIKPENRDRGGIELEQSVLVRGEQMAAQRETKRASLKAERQRRRQIQAQFAKEERDMGTPELRQKLVGRTRTQSLLLRYLTRRSINALQFAAGMRLWRAWTASGASSAPVSNWEPKVDKSSRGGDVPLSAVGDDRYRRALDAMGLGLSPIAVHVCVNDQSAEDWALSQGKPKNDGMPLLRAALDLLVDHYRLRARQDQSNKDIEFSPG